MHTSTNPFTDWEMAVVKEVWRRCCLLKGQEQLYAAAVIEPFVIAGIWGILACMQRINMIYHQSAIA
jgi:hypothetical protein